MNLKLANSRKELEQILILQNENHFDNLSKQIRKINGFVTVKHDINMLIQMNSLAKQVVAVVDEKVVGYALVMLKELKNFIPVLIPMFNSFKSIKYNNNTLDELNYYVMGQICISKEYRGKGLFKELYEKHKEIYSQKYDLCITGVSTSNKKSIIAHKKIGFKTICTFKDTYDEWNIICWNWN